jgi:hypothetical protein
MVGASIKSISAVAVVAATLALAPAAGGSVDPPSSAELRRAADRFLEHHDALAATPRAAGPESSPAPVLPDSRVVALYGAPQMGQTILGLTSPKGARRKLASQSAPYEELGSRPITGAFDLVTVFATAGGGADGLYRTRQDDQIIEIYLEQARLAGGRLILDIQPGRSTFLDEVRELHEWIAEPDVDVGLDPEWNVGRRGIPGQTRGKVSARQVKRVQRSLATTVAANDLPPKLLLVHQFRRGSVRKRGRIHQRQGVQTVLNFDGIGSPAAKAAGYEALSAPRLFDGFSLFYRRDVTLLKPGSVLALEPEPDLLLYQ